MMKKQIIASALLVATINFLACSTSSRHQPELALQLGHSSAVTAVAFSPDGMTLASGSGDNTVKLWDIEAGGVKRTLIGGENTVRIVAFSVDGKLVVCGSNDKAARLWDTQTGELKKTFAEHDDAVTAVAISPDSQTLACGSKDTVKLWNIQTGEVKKLLKVDDKGYSGIRSVVYSADGKTLIADSGNGLKFWDVQTGTEKQIVPDRFSPLTLLSDGKTIVSSGSGQTICLLDVGTGKEKEKRELNIDGVLSGFSEDGKVLVSLAANNTIKLWDARTGQEKQAFNNSDRGSLNAIAISPDSQWIASGSEDNTLRLWETKTGKTKWELKGQQSNDVRSASFLPDGKVIVIVGNEGTIRLLNTQTSEMKAIKSPTPTADVQSSVEELVLSPDGKMAASIYGGRLVGVWEIQSGKILKELNDPSIGVMGRHEGETKAKPLAFTHAPGVSGMAFSPDGNVVATGGDMDTALKIWDTATGKIKSRSRFGNAPTLSASGGMLTASFSDFIYPNEIVFSPDGKTVASAWADDKVRLCDAKTGKINLTIKAEDCQTIAFSPDGTVLASGSRNYSTKPGDIKLWNAQTGAAVRTLTGHTNGINSVAISPDGKIVASGSNDRTVKLWDIQGGEARQTLSGHISRVTSVAFSPDGKMLISASNDGTVKLWNPNDGQLLVTLQLLPSDKQKDIALDWIAYTSGSHYIGSASAEKFVNWKVGDSLVSVEKYKQTFYKADLLQSVLTAGK